MNLYDRDDGFRKFSLDEANALLPRIIVATERAVRLLKTLKDEFESEGRSFDLDRAQSDFDAGCEHILTDWAREVAGLGVYPKGHFTVDFKSPIPDTVFCWNFGEHTVSHSHKTYQSFKDRIPIQEKAGLGFENSQN